MLKPEVGTRQLVCTKRTSLVLCNLPRTRSIARKDEEHRREDEGKERDRGRADLTLIFILQVKSTEKLDRFTN